MKNLVVLIIMMIGLPIILSSQSGDRIKGDKIKVVFKNGDKLPGVYLSEDDKSITVLVDSIGEVNTSKKKISQIITIGSLNKEGKSENLLNNYEDQLFLMPTALPIGNGKRYYRNINILANTFNFGINDNFSISAGFESVSLFAGQLHVIFLHQKPLFLFKKTYRLVLARHSLLPQNFLMSQLMQEYYLPIVHLDQPVTISQLE